jgi:membrane protease YdiL (CAAX protease family)
MPKPRFFQWLTRQHLPAAEIPFRDLKAETRWLLWFAVLYILASVATGLAIKHLPCPLWGATYFTQDTWYVLGFKFALLLTLPLVIYRRWGYRIRELCHGWNLSVRSALVLVACYAAGVLINASRWSEAKAAFELHPTMEGYARAAIGVILPWFMAGIPEEVVYRGMLQTRLEAGWGRITAILVSVFLFVAWHIPTRFFLARGVEGEAGDFGSVLFGTGLPVAIVAIIFAWAWDRWRNLPALIAIHSGVDTLPILCSMLQSTAESYR